MTIETEYAGQTPLERRRALGQFFTPAPLARLMARWCLDGRPRTLLDPAVGTGVLVREALALDPGLAVTAYDLDPAVLAICAEALRPAPAMLRRADFLLAPPAERYDAIISNPPYLGYKELPYDDTIFDLVGGRCASPINRQSNLYVLFILQLTLQLAPGGRAAILVPSDWLNGNFGVPLKSYLLRERLLDALVVFDQRGVLFEDSLATSCLLLLRRDRDFGAPVLFATVSREPEEGEPPALGRFLALAGATCEYGPEQLDPAQKWLPLLPRLQPPSGQELRGLVPLRSLASVHRGLATGANDFFMLSAAQAAALELPEEALRPCLARAAHAPLADVTEADFALLSSAHARVLLLDPPVAPLPPALERYVAQGEALGIPRRYLPAHRRPWYRAERGAPAPILTTTFARGSGRFVLNRPLLAHLTAFHGITLHDDLQTPRWLYERALMAYLSTPLARGPLAAQQRRYGGGLLKWEPGDAASAPVPDLRAQPLSLLEELARLFDLHCLELRHALPPTALPHIEDLWRNVGRRARNK